MKKIWKVLIAVLCAVTMLSFQTIHPCCAEEVIPVVKEPDSGNFFLKELFFTRLPKTLQENRVQVSLVPRFNNIFALDYLRFPLLVKYGITENWSMFSKIESAVDLDSNLNNDFFFLDLVFGTKYYLEYFHKRTSWYVAVGNDFRFPLGNPPAAFRDEFTHICPYIAVQHTLDKNNTFDFFANIGLDLLTDTPFRSGQPVPGKKYHSLDINPGILYRWKNYRLALPLNYHTTRISSGNLDQVYISPALFWSVPQKYTEKAPGDLELGTGVRIGLHDYVRRYEMLVRISWRWKVKQ